jgi:hypothetical protein
LRQWTSSIYAWLTHPILDPTHSGRVTMDNLMKMVTTALERSYLAGETDVRAERLKSAAELLALRHDTLKLIDGAFPSTEAPQPPSTEQGNGSKTELETKPEGEAVQANNAPHNTETVVTAGEQVQPVKTPKCTFPGKVSIELERFLNSDTQLVECPDCGRTRTLSPSKGVIKFSSHEKRKTNTPNTGKRWVMRETIWKVVGG